MLQKIWTKMLEEVPTDEKVSKIHSTSYILLATKA